MIIKKAPPVTSRTQKKMLNPQRPPSATKKPPKIKNDNDYFESIGPWIKQEINVKREASTQTLRGNHKLSSKGQQFILKSHRNRIKHLSIAFHLNPEDHIIDAQAGVQADEQFVRHADSEQSKFLRSKIGTEKDSAHYSLNKLKASEQILQMKMLKSPTQVKSSSKYYSQQLVERKMSMNKFRTLDSLPQKQLKAKKACKQFSHIKSRERSHTNPIGIQNRVEENMMNFHSKALSKNQKVKSHENEHTENLLFYLKARRNNNIMMREKNIMKIRNLMNKKSQIRLKTDGLMQ